jgi:hypothetical protein
MNTRGRRKRIQWVIDNPIDAADKIAELEAKLSKDSQHFEIQCLRQVDRKYTALVGDLRELAEKWKTLPSFYDLLTAQETCQANARELLALLEAINSPKVDRKVSILIEEKGSE